MEQIVHLANTNVEFEYAHSSQLSIEQSFSQSPICLQLQFLPLLFARNTDIVAVTALPTKDYLTALQKTGWWPKGLPHLVPLQDVEPFYGKRCQSWGPSRQIQGWAKSRHMHYPMPSNWEMICLVNSKAFSFRYTCLPEAALLYNEHELFNWLQSTKGLKVLKTCFGLSGKGNRRIDNKDSFPKILSFCRKEWNLGHPIVGEPWLDRLYDFSTQWFIHPNQQIEWIGATRFETDAQGTYEGTLAGPEEILFASLESFLQQHRTFAKKALSDIAALGFFGFIGIDAFVYLDSSTQSTLLYPLVEINGRQTMSLIALLLQKNLCPGQILRLNFQSKPSSQFSLLPNQLVNDKGETVTFRRQLAVSFL
jgi:hypothetical protein